MIYIYWCHCHSIISCFIKIQILIGLTFLVPAYPGCQAGVWLCQFRVCYWMSIFVKPSLLLLLLILYKFARFRYCSYKSILVSVIHWLNFAILLCGDVLSLTADLYLTMSTQVQLVPGFQFAGQRPRCSTSPNSVANRTSGRLVSMYSCVIHTY